MSLIKSIEAQLNTYMESFCEVLAKKYKLNKTELYDMWVAQGNVKVEKKKEVAAASDAVSVTSESSSAGASGSVNAGVNITITREQIMASTRDALTAICKAKGIKQSGKKDEVVKRLLDWLDANPSTDAASAAAAPAAAKPLVAKKPAKKEIEKTQVMSNVIESKIDQVVIRRNKFGNHEHFETGLVFNADKVVIGHQNENSQIDSLTDKLIETCKKYKFTYKLPANLSTNRGLDGVKVADLDEEEEEDEELDDEDLEVEEEEIDVEAEIDD